MGTSLGECIVFCWSLESDDEHAYTWFTFIWCICIIQGGEMEIIDRLMVL